MARKAGGAGEPPAEAPVAATVMLALGRTKGTHRFEHLAVSTDDPAHVTVVLSNDDGHKIAVMLPRAEVKRLLTWRMIMSL
jgi:2-succinyl-5-enolpyruvyl-6-hydroxy-3-cyclohexene-1-carboxylate synthase